MDVHSTADDVNMTAKRFQDTDVPGANRSVADDQRVGVQIAPSAGKSSSWRMFSTAPDLK